MKSINDGKSEPGALRHRQMIEPQCAPGCASSRVYKELNQASRQRSRSIRLSILLVLLGASVFLWGLGYKLSQYDTHGFKIPEAKLLANNEDSRPAGGMQVSTADGLTLGTVLIGLLSIGAVLSAVNAGSSLSARTSLDDASGDPLCPKFILGALFFRPPPIHSVL